MGLIPLSGVDRVVTYNVYLGFDKKNKLDACSEWIRSVKPDVLALQELKGFNSERFVKAAQSWGHEYAVIYERKGGFPQGVSSRFPIEFIEQIEPDDPRNLRGTLHCVIEGVHYFVVHFDPRDFLRRQIESKAVLAKIRPLLEEKQSVVVLGDFNAHSIEDADSLDKQGELLAKWRMKEAESDAHRSFDEDGNLDMSVLQGFFDLGLCDLSVDPLPTFPTRLHFPELDESSLECLQHRIDFILVSEDLAHAASISYPREAVLDSLSDHYPLILDFL